MAKKKKKKLKVKNIFIFLLILCAIGGGIFYFYNLKIKSITVKGNTLFTDEEIISMGKIDNYPSYMELMQSKVEKSLEKSEYIKSAKVSKKWFLSLEIKVEENIPLFYYVPNQATILSNKKECSDNFSVPTLVNYVPNKIYDDFIEKMKNVDYNIVKRISEIKYDPNDVDDERFLLTMNDGNYVYLTLDKFNKINHYLDIIKEFDNKKGILYLDSGEYFKVF